VVQCSTSASAAAVAGMVSLVNSARLQLGRSRIGFINAIIYENSSFFAKDITSGILSLPAWSARR
jgi:hypothetical protein